jgi:hypothetical protein
MVMASAAPWPPRWVRERIPVVGDASADRLRESAVLSGL